VGDYFRGIKIQHTGERPSCRICGTPATCGSTLKQDGVTERYYKCSACGTPLKTYEETPPEEAVKSTKRAPSPTHPAHIQEGTKRRKRKRA
jgi:tRNA(Ile2) C34 agmatinyltransferase TiaS